MKNLSLNTALALLLAAASFVSSLALAVDACRAKELNGTWSCERGLSLIFDVSGNTAGVYQMNPTKSLGIPIILDGQLHNFTVSGITIATTGTCNGPVVSIKGNNNGLMDFAEQFTLQDTKKMVVSADINGQTLSVPCSKK